jgi:glycerate kinase
VRFIDQNGAVITEPLGGGRLEEIHSIDTSGVLPGLANVAVSVACDVTNPYTGEKGASAVYGPQKGATPAMVQVLDRNLGYFATLIKRDLGRDIVEQPGAGAGGGLGGGLLAFTNAVMKRGVELVVEATKLDEHMKGASLAITGEGRVDFQTAFGKTPAGVAACARRHGVPVVAIGGGLSEDANGVFEHGIDAIETVTPGPLPLEVAMAKSREFLQNAGERLARLIVVGQRMALAAGQPTSDAGAPPAAGGDTPPSQANGSSAAPLLAQPIAQRNKPVKKLIRAKRVQGLTRAAVELSLRRQRPTL